MHEDLIVSAMPEARTTALVFQRTRQRHLDPDEAVSIAYLELVKSAPRFDAGRGLKFWTYARPRIIGALLDHLRAHSQLSGARGKEVELADITMVSELIPAIKPQLPLTTVLLRVVGELDPADRKIIQIYANASRNPELETGMRRENFYYHKVRIVRRLRAALKARGVTKVADVL
jgi:hypothetical protein